MAIKLVPVKCPECGAMLDIEKDRTQAFCTYCGAKVLVHNENEFTFHHVDVADLERAETERIVKLKEIEFAEKDRINKEKNKHKIIKYVLIFLVVGLCTFALGGYLSEGSANPEAGSALVLVGVYLFLGAGIAGALLSDSKNNPDGNKMPKRKVKIPSNITDLDNKPYTVIAALLESAGFSNVKCVALNDLRTNFFIKSGTIHSISINGERPSLKKDYPEDAAVVITYHSKA